MRRLLFALSGIALVAVCGLARAASWQVFVQPGVYGRVAVGGYVEPPRVYSAQPVMAVSNGSGRVVEEVIDPAYATDQPPVYLWVPEYQRLHWAEFSAEYGAHGVPVYFVDDGWYRANVLRRNWTSEQRAWTEQQWLEQDRLARDRFERQRFEQQRFEQQQRWDNARIWRNPQQAGNADRALAEQPQRQRQADDLRSQQAQAERERADQADTRPRGFWGVLTRAFSSQRPAASGAARTTSAASRPQGVDRADDRPQQRIDRRGDFERGREPMRGH